MNSEKRRKLRVVADTNIFVSALNFGSEAEIFLEMAASRLFHLFISRYILWEIRMVLQKKFGWTRAMITEAMRVISAVVVIIPQTKQFLSVIREDEADNRILECAIAAKANALVTNDKKHLLPLGSYKGIQIVGLKEFLSKFRPAVNDKS